MGRSYKDLIAWQIAMDLVLGIYHSTRGFPREEVYGLTSQLRRAAVSVASNIAEGQGRLSKREFHQFLGQPRGSLMEIETQIQIAQRLNYLEDGQAKSLLAKSAEAGRILNGLIASMRSLE